MTPPWAVVYAVFFAATPLASEKAWAAAVMARPAARPVASVLWQAKLAPSASFSVPRSVRSPADSPVVSASLPSQ